MKTQETTIECPFCHEVTIKILHIPFVANTFTSGCRAGGRNNIYQKERFDVISGCETCGKTQKEIQKALETGKTKILTHEERIAMFKKRGLPMILESKK